MTDRDNENLDDEMNGSTTHMDVQAGTSQQQLKRTPPSPGENPGSKKHRASPDPAPVAREAIKWIRYTLEVAATKKSSMTVDIQRSMFEKLKDLDTAVHDRVVSNLQLSCKLEEARRSAEICVEAAAAQFETELRLRESAHEQTLEAVVARYAEKEAIRASETAAMAEQAVNAQKKVVDTEPRDQEPSFSQVMRRFREPKNIETRKADRFKSRAVNRNKRIKEERQTDYIPAYVIKNCEGKKPKEIRDHVWKVVSQKVKPKCHSVTTKEGKVIIKPLNKETADVLKSLSKGSLLISEDSLRWPRIIINGVQAEMEPGQIQERILTQNDELGIPEGTEDTVLKPIFKQGKRDRGTTN